MTCLSAETLLEIKIDGSPDGRPIRALHGVNNGPLNCGEIVDLTSYFKTAGIPLVRLHDSAWPYPDIVDIHAVFPDAKADPENPASYRFGPTDDYLRAITNAGASIVYRLGESIEHAKRKRYVHPPADPVHWAAICAGFIRHYNEGWADGHRLNIRYWEIWNEPENRPAMWTGSAEDYFRLYTVAAKSLKARWPGLKIGGPSLGHQGEFKSGTLEPSKFLQGFLAAVKRENAPLDFFSWHLYSNDPLEIPRRARAIRAFLDAQGLPKAESHLNEWNYLPGNDWTPMISKQGPSREHWYAEQGGPAGAAFAARALMLMQGAPVDAANFYSGDHQPFGLFSFHGTPKKNYHAFAAFERLRQTSRSIPCVVSNDKDWTAMAGSDAPSDSVVVLLAGTGSERVTLEVVQNLPPIRTASLWMIDAEKSFEEVERAELREGRFRFKTQLRPPLAALMTLARGKL